MTLKRRLEKELQPKTRIYLRLTARCCWTSNQNRQMMTLTRTTCHSPAPPSIQAQRRANIVEVRASPTKTLNLRRSNSTSLPPVMTTPSWQRSLVRSSFGQELPKEPMLRPSMTSRSCMTSSFSSSTTTTVLTSFGGKRTHLPKSKGSDT